MSDETFADPTGVEETSRGIMSLIDDDGTIDGDAVIQKKTQKRVIIQDEEPEPEKTPEEEPEEESESKPDDKETEDSEEEPEETPEEEPEDEPEEEPEVEPEEDSIYELDPDLTYLINGNELTGKEVQDGFLRQSDYTRKTQALAEERRQMESELEQVRYARDAWKAQLDQWGGDLRNLLTDQNIDWQKLADEDPQEYVKQREAYNQKVQKLEQIEQERARIHEQEQREQQQNFVAYVRGEHEALLEAIPQWKNPQVFEKEKSELSGFLLDQGFTEAELSNLWDHRQVLLCRKAKAYDDLIKKGKQQIKKKKVVKLPKVTKPGITKSKKDVGTDGYRKGFKRAMKTGSLDDAAAALLAGDFDFLE